MPTINSYKNQSSEIDQTNKYRPDIDWLRGFAVLSVLFFHAFPAWIPGGYSGVDVFFVISGFLISTIIKQEVEENNFTLRSFYARRIRRIFPALILVMAATLGAGWWLLLDDEYKKLGNHAMRASVFLSNFTLWKEAGYFDEASELKPLLHLWSLAIEEQFYIIWPLMMIGLFKLGAKGGVTLGLLTLASFGWNLYVSPIDSTHVFYSPLTRFWELMAGAFLAWHWAWIQSRINAKTQEWLGLCGLLILFAGLWFLGHASGFPGAWALAPVLGAMALIASAAQLKWIGTLPAFRLFLWFGAISYPLYLWHWPIFSLIRMIEGTRPSLSIQLASMFISILLATLTTRYMEPYFRHGPLVRGRIASLCCAMAIICLVGYWINQRQGVPDRYPTQPRFLIHSGSIGHAEYLEGIRTLSFVCDNNNDYRPSLTNSNDLVNCIQSQPQGESRLLLLGDSHAEHLFAGFASQLPNQNITFLGGLGLPTWDNPNFQHALKRLESGPAFEWIIVAGHWHPHFAKKSSVDVEEKLASTIRFLQNKAAKVIVLDDIYEFNFTPVHCKYLRPLSNRTQCEESREKMEAQRSKYLPRLKQVIEALPDTHFVAIADTNCNANSCSMMLDEQIIYRDTNHLNLRGSVAVSNVIIHELYLNKIWPFDADPHAKYQ